MLVVLTGDELSVLLSACSLLQLSPTTRLLLVLSPQQHTQQPWTITQLHAVTTPLHVTLSNASIQRSLSSMMFLETVQQVKYQGRPDTLLIRPSPSFSKMMMYQPQALKEYLIQLVQSHQSQCTVIDAGDLHKERLMRDLNKIRKPYFHLDLSTSQSLSKSRYNLSQVRWMGMDHDLRLPQRSRVDDCDAMVRIKHVGAKNGVKVFSVGTAGQLQIAVKMSDCVVELVGQRLMEEMRWARL